MGNYKLVVHRMRLPHPPSYIILWRTICGVVSSQPIDHYVGPLIGCKISWMRGQDRCIRTPQLMSNWAHYTFLTVLLLKSRKPMSEFDEHLVRRKECKIGVGVMIHTFGRWQTTKRRSLMECAFSMKHDNQIV
jgi:hypothetical protein